jgi:cytochrome b subunit of formate dehydrogenase
MKHRQEGAQYNDIELALLHFKVAFDVIAIVSGIVIFTYFFHSVLIP